MADLFESATTEQEEQPTQEAQTPAQEDQPDQKVTFKVGDREYDAEAAAKKISSADDFIEKLLQEKRDVEAQLEEARKQATGQTKLDEALELMRKQQAVSTEQPSQETPAVDQSALMEMVRKLAQEEAKSTYETESQRITRERNEQASLQAAKERYGDSFGNILLERGQHLGMTKEEVQELAGTKPEMFKELFVPKVQGGKPYPQGSVNSAAVAGAQKKEAPTIGKHFNSKTRVEALREAERFYAENPELLNL